MTGAGDVPCTYQCIVWQLTAYAACAHAYRRPLGNAEGRDEETREELVAGRSEERDGVARLWRGKPAAGWWMAGRSASELYPLQSCCTHNPRSVGRVAH